MNRPTPLALAVLLALAASGPARAEGPLQHAPEPADDDDDDQNFLDASHAFLEDRILDTVLRLDRFFSDERDLEFERSRSFVRWRNEVRFDTEGAPSYRLAVRASLRFPGLNRLLERVRLDIAGQTDDTLDTLFPRDPGAAAPAQGGGGDGVGRADAELRFRVLHTLRTHVDLGAGVILAVPPGLFARARFRWARPLGRRLLFRLAEQGFVRSDVGLGQKTDAELERALGPRTSLRLLGTGLVHGRTDGLEFGGDLGLWTRLGSRAALATGVGLRGATSPLTRVDQYRAYARVRRDFYRRWLFLEVEPELGLPRRPGGTYDRVVPAVFVRLDVQFQGGDPSRLEVPGVNGPVVAPPRPAR